MEERVRGRAEGRREQLKVTAATAEAARLVEAVVGHRRLAGRGGVGVTTCGCGGWRCGTFGRHAGVARAHGGPAGMRQGQNEDQAKYEAETAH